jgi:hypothetical protein
VLLDLSSPALLEAGDEGINFVDPQGEILQSLHKPCGFYLFSLNSLKKASFFSVFR